MIAFPSLALILALATPAKADHRVSEVAPFVGSEVALVAHLDLTRLDIEKLAHPVLSRLGDEEDVREWSDRGTKWVAMLRQAGAKDLYVLVSLEDLPGPPVAVVPLSEGADAQAIGRVLCGGGNEKPPYAWPTCATIHHAVFAGTTAALDRARRPLGEPRPDLASAFEDSGDGPVRLLILPSLTQRRVLEEFVPILPKELGGGPSTSLIEGLRWASITLETEAKPALRLVVKAKDAATARRLIEIGKDALTSIGQADQGKAVAAEIARIRPEVADDRITARLDLDRAADLAVIPYRAVMETSERSRCVENLKMIGLAMHNYHSTHSSFPPAASRDKAGRPLLSWRVQLLPFLDQEALFKEFHLDEAWDSPHNKPLIARMPQVFACPNESRTLRKSGKTTYLTPRGKATIFTGGDGIKINEITDGTSNTILVVDASDELAVIWTKPDDWDVDPELKKDSLFGHHAGGVRTLFADGSARRLKSSITVATLRALLTRNGGEVISVDNY